MLLNFDLSLEVKEDLVVDDLRRILYLSMKRMEEIAIRTAPVAFGALKLSIKLFPDLPGFDQYVLADGVDYGVFVEYGTLPHTPPIEPLKRWAELKLGDAELGWAVRAKIAKFGTQAQPFFRPALHQVRTVYLPVITRGVLLERGSR